VVWQGWHINNRRAFGPPQPTSRWNAIGGNLAFSRPAGASAVAWLLRIQPSEGENSTVGEEFRPPKLAELEALLFLAREPLGTRKLAQLAGLADGTEARTLVRKLNRLYDQEGSSFRIEAVAGGVQLMTRTKFAPWLRRLQSVPVEVQLSTPMMETLAVVAYRQPVLRAEVEAIRGVQCGEILRQLMERDLVRIVGRSDELGRPFLYGTTRDFLRIFGLGALEDLPRPAGLREAAKTFADGDSGMPGHVSDNDLLNSNDNHSQSEEANVKVLAMKKKATSGLVDERTATLAGPLDDTRIGSSISAFKDEDEGKEEDEEEDDWDDDDDDEDEEDDDWDDDEDDDFEDDEEDLDEDDDEDLEDDWEEVEDDDEDLDEEDDDDDDEDWDDDDEDWDDDDEEDDDEDEDEDWEDDAE
jgi:segregation and condensation protein B